MKGIETIQALFEGKALKLVEPDYDPFIEGTVIKLKTNEKGLMELVLADKGVRTDWGFETILQCEFEEMPEYRLTFFEAMRALEQGRTVANDRYPTPRYRVEDGKIVDEDGEATSFYTSEISAKWKIVE